ncbi:MAG: hypothetical protein FJ405_14315 [Verrucomicrobia bacterium]|nr:hypothetical protein [Verrucomicrobiota bacterium]
MSLKSIELDSAFKAGASDAWTPDPGRFQALLNVSTESLAILSGSGEVIEWRPFADASAAFPLERTKGRKLSELVPARIASDVSAMMKRALGTGQTQIALFEIPMDPMLREIEVRIAPSGVDEVVAGIRDLTDRRQLEREILEISHREQQRIGQDLHDSLGQHLTGISFLSKALSNRLQSKALSEAAEADEIAQLVVETLGHTRNIARGLCPIELEKTGQLLPALRGLASNTERLFHVVCSLDMRPDQDLVDARVSTELFRITQEAISNAVRHGKARRITVSFRMESAEAVLSIQDDGSGLVGSGRMGGLGLRIMGFRAHRIGGVLNVAPLPERGVEVMCRFPMVKGSAPERSREAKQA